MSSYSLADMEQIFLVDETFGQSQNHGRFWWDLIKAACWWGRLWEAFKNVVQKHENLGQKYQNFGQTWIFFGQCSGFWVKFHCSTAPIWGRIWGGYSVGGNVAKFMDWGGGQNVVWPPFKRELSAIKKRMVYHGQHLNFGPFWPLHLKMTVSAPGQNGLPCVKLPCFGTGLWLTQIPHWATCHVFHTGPLVDPECQFGGKISHISPDIGKTLETNETFYARVIVWNQTYFDRKCLFFAKKVKFCQLFTFFWRGRNYWPIAPSLDLHKWAHGIMGPMCITCELWGEVQSPTVMAQTGPVEAKFGFLAEAQLTPSKVAWVKGLPLPPPPKLSPTPPQVNFLTWVPALLCKLGRYLVLTKCIIACKAIETIAWNLWIMCIKLHGNMAGLEKSRLKLNLYQPAVLISFSHF